MLFTKEDLNAFPSYAPLIAAILAPLSTLLDIPALVEPWFFQQNPDTGNLTKLPDPPTNITLSAVGLFFNVLANALLILRFSTTGGIWKYATIASLACWVAKFGIALGNIIAFGILSRNTPGISYGEGFCVVSLILVFVIVVLLQSHFWLYVHSRMHQPFSASQIRVRIAGRHFMLENTLLVLTIGVMAVYMSQLEHWTYLQGIYFSIVSILTVGFGDFVPTKASTRIALFPFVLIGIIQLASIIDLIVRFFRARFATRRAKQRQEFEKRRQEEEDELAKEPSLERELEFLRKLYRETDHWKTKQDLVASCIGFLLFWLVGAVIFSRLESWTYGEGLYFCYVFFFTIGYGDFVPVTPAGRVVFIVYSLFAVPIMASFAVQTIQSIFQNFSANVLQRNQEKATRGKGLIGSHTEQEPGVIVNTEDEEKGLPRDIRDRIRKCGTIRKFRSHADFVTAEHKQIESKLTARSNISDSGGSNEGTRSPEEEADEGQEREQEDRILTEYILELAVELEKRARRLLLGHMEEGSSARMLLKADRLVQLRNIKALAAQEQTDPDNSHATDETSTRTRTTDAVPDKRISMRKMNTMMRKYYEEEVELLPFPTDLSEQETLEEIAHYREAFAGILAAGSRLLRLKDEEKFLFERRYWRGTREDR